MTEAMTEAEHILVVKRSYKASVTRLFDAFADVEKFAQWFAPNPRVKLELYEYDFRSGGSYRIGFTEPGGGTATVGGTYVAIENPNKIVFTWEWQGPHTYAGQNTLVTIDMTQNGEQTDLVLTHEKLPSTEAKANHNEGWSGALNTLGTWVSENPET